VVYSRICVAAALQRYLDVTPIATRIRELARVLALADRARVTVLSVEAPVDLLPEVETMKEKLDRYAQPLIAAGLEVEAVLRQGRPSREIAAFVEASAADLLIIGSHSKRGALDVGLGSTATALMRELDVPVIMVRPTSDEQEKARDLMIPKYPIVFPYG
jgi:nucleotide-binding universal stress UspA family protein